MKDAVILLLCAIALADGFNHELLSNSRSCNCNPSEAQQICEANYGKDDVLIAHENCDKFYKCANGKPFPYKCPNNLLYDPYKEECEWPWLVDCGDRPISEGSDQEDGGGDNDNNDSNDNNDVDDGWTCNCNPSEAPSICAAEGSSGVLVAHENCDQFYMCDAGRPVTFDCPPTLM
ncbi:chitin binding domain-containing protein, partial [Clostridium perfringens]|nr:chitin binding domain-containing protein [Clostridium perfringens]